MLRPLSPPLPVETALDRTGERLQDAILRLFKRSLYIRHVDAGSCNGCESEIKQLTSPYYDIHRLGIFFTATPRHADLLLVTGPVTRGMEAPLRRTYEAMPDPRLVVGVGACACTGGIFGASGLTRGGLAGVLPVDVLIPGCPPTPLALIHGLLLAVGRAEQKLTSGEMKSAGASQTAPVPGARQPATEVRP
jgi:formate hydrogenlyase subunit 7